MQNSNDRGPVTVIGLGMMGTALAETFLNNDRPTTVWNRSAKKADDLVSKGAHRAATVTEAVAASGVVVVCVSTYEVLHEILEPVSHALSGRVLVNLTSGTPDEARQTAGWAAERGVEYLDGAIMAVPPMIGQAETLIFYAGSRDAFDANQPTLAVLGGAATYLGTDTGIPMLYDVALLGILWSTLAGYFHALALVGTEKITAAEFLPYATAWITHVALPSMPYLGREVDEGNYATEISSLDVNKAAIAHLIDASKAQGIGVEVMIPIQKIIDRRVAEGHGNDSLASLIEAIRRPQE